MAVGGAGAGFLECGGECFDLGAGGGEGGFLGFSALEAGELLVFKASCLRGFEGDFVLDSGGLLGGFDGVELGAKAGDFLAVGGDVAIETGAEGLLAADGGGGFSRLELGGVEGGLGLGDLSRQSAEAEGQAGTLQVDVLQLYEIFNLRLHPCYEVYVIHRVLRKQGTGDRGQCTGDRGQGKRRGMGVVWGAESAKRRKKTG